MQCQRKVKLKSKECQRKVKGKSKNVQESRTMSKKVEESRFAIKIIFKLLTWHRFRKTSHLRLLKVLNYFHMAKQKGAVGLKGKIGEFTFTDGKNGKRVKKSAEFTAKQKEDARQRPQVIRTNGLNVIASPLRHAIRHYNHGHVDPDFWTDILQALRKEKTNHRVLLLKKTVGLEVDRARTLEASCPPPPIIVNTTPR